jgi:hypothetical protein
MTAIEGIPYPTKGGGASSRPPPIMSSQYSPRTLWTDYIRTEGFVLRGFQKGKILTFNGESFNDTC